MQRGVGWVSLMVAMAGVGCSASDDGGSPLPPFGPGSGGTAAAAPVNPAPGSTAAPSAPAGGSGSQLDRPQDMPVQVAPGAGGTGGAAPAAGSGGTGEVTTPPAARTLSNVLVFSRTVGYRHDSIPTGIETIRRLGEQNGFAVQQTEDPAMFTDQALAAFQVVVFMSTTADVLGDEQQAAFERYIAAGNGWVGVHSAADTEYDWAWYGGLLGGDAWFLIHPAIQNAELQVEDAAHASTAHLPATFTLQDEWYNYRNNPRPEVNVLLRLNEASYQVGEGAMGADHPIAWYHEYAGGRAWYTGLGHRIELYSDPQFVNHLLGGIRWAAGVSE
jgi:type 1 glutamine amidotransferase